MERMRKDGLSSKVFSVCGTISANRKKLASYWKGVAPSRKSKCSCEVAA